jgi:DNA-binding MarR family transcriptional regulator
MTRWLTAEEQDLWRSVLYGFTRMMNVLDDSLQSHSDLAIKDYEILVRLSESPDRQLRMSELADQVLISRSRLTYRVDQLIRRGLVSRVECDDDRRGIFAQLTPTGLETLAAAASLHVEDVRRQLIDHVDASQIQQLTTLFGDIDRAARDSSTD